ncbi:ribonuclease H-like domain-containing protein [Tanacetum coccineum]
MPRMPPLDIQFVSYFEHGGDYIKDPDLVTLIKKAKHVWEELKETYVKVDGSVVFGLHHQIHSLKKNGSSITDYYHKLHALWKLFVAMIELPKYVCNAFEGFKKHNQLLKLMQFLMGLDNSYMQIRSSILSREVLPDVRSAYSSISSEESRRVAAGSIVGSSQRNQAYAFVSSMPNRSNFQRNNQNVSNGPPRPNNLNNIRQGVGSALVCENYGFNGYTIDRCFKIIGYPAGFGKKKCGQNVKGINVSNNNSVGSSSSFGLQINKWLLLSLLSKTIKLERMCTPIWQVGHPNGTEAFISKIRNLKLSNCLVLYDVMVILEYYVTLISVHKLAKENKVIIAFDESKCYFSNQDLNLRNVLRIGNQCEGLYYYNDQGIISNNNALRYQYFLSQHDWHCRLGHPPEHVLNVLKESLQIDNKDKNVCCEICLRAKQTREPFPLSDHTSKFLGDLVHFDLWGPYKVTSSKWFRYFLTVVDAYTRAI